MMYFPRAGTRPEDVAMYATTFALASNGWFMYKAVE